MRWEGQERSSNVDDRRRRQMRNVGGGIGIGTIIVYLIMTFMGQDASALLEQPSGTTTSTEVETGPRPDDKLAELVEVTLKKTENVWNRIFPEQLNRQYREPTLVLFSGQDQSACGFASAATGPFYCPADQQVYIDLSFYQELATRFQAPGDFAMAYIVAHEVGHHVQNLLGITQQMEQQRRRLSQTEFNKLSVRLELQADFLAGVWAHHAEAAERILEEGDIEEAMRAAAAVGDDRIQKQARGYVVPDSFTHGTSEQRVRWFIKGFKTGDLSQGDTFSATSL
ncbi:MAG: neutral zinc metallopeptidase [Saprospiraceae bacterium]|nr:neutral zinc metallopeptidase [Lewinella sp.]